MVGVHVLNNLNEYSLLKNFAQNWQNSQINKLVGVVTGCRVINPYIYMRQGTTIKFWRGIVYKNFSQPLDSSVATLILSSCFAIICERYYS